MNPENSMLGKTVQKGHISCDSIYRKCLEYADPEAQDVDRCLPRDESTNWVENSC